MKVKFKQDEYMYLFDEVMGSSTVFHNKTLRDTTGDELILAMAQEIEELRKELSQAMDIIEDCGIVYGEMLSYREENL